MTTPIPDLLAAADAVADQHIRAITGDSSVCWDSDPDIRDLRDAIYIALLNAHAAGVRAAETALPAPSSGWLPISEAPKDGTWLMLAKYVGHPAHATSLWWLVKGHWSDRFQNWNDGVEPAGLAAPTHWQPLPGAPA